MSMSKRPAKPAQRPITSSGSAPHRILTLEVRIEKGPMTPDFMRRNPRVSRTIVIGEGHSLSTLHRVIFIALDRFDEHLYEFRVGESRPQDPRAHRFVLRSEIAELAASGRKAAGDVATTRLADLGLSVGDEFRYWFDFGDDWWHVIRVLAIAEEPGRQKPPRVILRLGESPPQYGPFEELDNDGEGEGQ